MSKIQRFVLLSHTRRLFFLLFLFFALISHGIGNFTIFTSSENRTLPTEKPEFIQIPSLSLILPMQTARIQDDQWLITETPAAFFGEKSAFPGTPGTTIVFAHARQGLFADLPVLHPDNIIVLQTHTMLYFYQIKEKKIIDPTDVGFLSKPTESHQNMLVVFTCYGKADTKRIVFFAPLRGIVPIREYKKSYI